MKQRPPFPGPVIALVTSQQQLAALLAKHGGAAGPAASWQHMRGAAGITWTLEIGGAPVFIVGLNMEHIQSGLDAVTTIVHEATHVKQGFMEMIGEDSPSIEFEAYVMESISANLLEQWDALVARASKRKRPRKAPKRAQERRSGRGR